jgi:hypothetical protein
MIKKYLGLVLFLSLSLFLVMPVYAAEPDPFEKITDVYPGDLDYRNSLIDWNGYNLDFDIYWNKQGGLPPDIHRLFVYENETIIYTLSNWDYDAGLDLYKLRLNAEQRAKTFKTLLNINLGSIYIADSLNQSHVGLISAFAITIDIIGIENAIGGGQATFIMDRLTLETETTHPIGTGSIAAGRQLAQYNFINKYTNVHALYYNFVISANSYVPDTARTEYYIYQLGFFADSQVILPDLNVDTDFQIYEPTTCGAIDLGCVSRNLIGEFSNNIYKRLGAENMASGVMSIYDTIFYPVYIVNNVAWQNGILSIYAIVSLGVLYLIVKRVLS